MTSYTKRHHKQSRTLASWLFTWYSRELTPLPARSRRWRACVRSRYSNRFSALSRLALWMLSKRRAVPDFCDALSAVAGVVAEVLYDRTATSLFTPAATRRLISSQMDARRTYRHVASVRRRQMYTKPG